MFAGIHDSAIAADMSEILLQAPSEISGTSIQSSFV